MYPAVSQGAITALFCWIVAFMLSGVAMMTSWVRTFSVSPSVK